MNIDLDKLIPGCKYFRWKEVLHCPQWRVYVFPNDKQYLNLLEVCKVLDHIRKTIGLPITVTSGLRPVKYNQLIGGARLSAHKLGMALDFQVKGMRADDVRATLLPRLESYGIRMEDLPGSNWVHIDTKQSNNRFFKP